MKLFLFIGDTEDNKMIGRSSSLGSLNIIKESQHWFFLNLRVHLFEGKKRIQ